MTMEYTRTALRTVNPTNRSTPLLAPQAAELCKTAREMADGQPVADPLVIPPPGVKSPGAKEMQTALIVIVIRNAVGGIDHSDASISGEFNPYVLLMLLS